MYNNRYGNTRYLLAFSKISNTEILNKTAALLCTYRKWFWLKLIEKGCVGVIPTTNLFSYPHEQLRIFDILTLKLLQIIICKSWINVFAEVNFRHFTFETCSSAALQFASTIHDVLDFSSIVLLRIKTRGDQYTCCQTHATTIVTMASGILIFGIYFFYYLLMQWGDEGLKTFDIFDGIQRQATTLFCGNHKAPLRVHLYISHMHTMYIIIMYTHIVTRG